MNLVPSQLPLLTREQRLDVASFVRELRSVETPSLSVWERNQIIAATARSRVRALMREALDTGLAEFRDGTFCQFVPDDPAYFCAINGQICDGQFYSRLSHRIYQIEPLGLMGAKEFMPGKLVLR